jgi:rhodanese-related sulfurtransferase
VYAEQTPAPATPPVGKPVIAKICTNCHAAEPGVLRGHFDNVSFKSKAIQLKIDDGVELLKFDEKTIQVVNDEKKSGDGELLKNNKIKKGHEVKIAYTEVNGVKTATKFVAKPPVELPKEMLMSTASLEKLVAQGPEKGKYFLFDSRPAPRFQEGTIPTAVNLPFPAFDKMAEKVLPADKNALLIFFCSGVTCNMSPGSAAKAKKLGYTNLKVYKEGMPEWSQKNYGVLSAQFLKDAWLTKDISHVLLDVRTAKESASGFIKGAVAFPADNSKKLIKGFDLKLKKAPIIVYDAQGRKDSVKVAAGLVKAGFVNVKVVVGGFDAWKNAGFEVASGKPADKVTYVAKLRQGEIAIDEFKKIAAATPANVVIVDVRNPDETSKGMLKNALTIPLSELRERVAELPKDKQIILQCNTGTQAEMAYHTLKELGFTNHKFLNAKIKIERDGKFDISKD